MYKITVPVKNENFERAGREEIVKKLKSDGRIEGNKVYLSDIFPFDFVAFEVR